MQTHNRDIFPSSAMSDQYNLISPLLNQPHFDDAFRSYDQKALGAKMLYHRFGQASILMVAFSAIFTIAEALVLPGLFQNKILTYFAAAMALTGIVLQCYIIFTKQKQKWLINRYAAEYVRSLNFQSYVLAHQARDEGHLEALLAEFAKRSLNKLDHSLNAGYSILADFSPGKILEQLISEVRAQPENSEISAQADGAFSQLRFEYQRNFARNQIESFRGRRRIFNSTQDMIYLSAAVFAFLSLGAKVLTYMGAELQTDWIDFIAVTLFILGATEAIMDNALLEEQSQARFEQYMRDLDEATASYEKLESRSFPEYVMAVEGVCLGELGEFCRSAEKISYRF